MSFSDHEVRLWLAANVDVARQDGTAERVEMGESALAAFDRLRARVAELEAAAAGAERGSAQEAREHMRFQNAIEQRLREHGAGYETEPWFPDVIYGAAAAALAAAGAVRVEEGQ